MNSVQARQIRQAVQLQDTRSGTLQEVQVCQSRSPVYVQLLNDLRQFLRIPAAFPVVDLQMPDHSILNMRQPPVSCVPVQEHVVHLPDGLQRRSVAVKVHLDSLQASVLIGVIKVALRQRRDILQLPPVHLKLPQFFQVLNPFDGINCSLIQFNALDIIHFP